MSHNQRNVVDLDKEKFSNKKTPLSIFFPVDLLIKFRILISFRDLRKRKTIMQLETALLKKRLIEHKTNKKPLFQIASIIKAFLTRASNFIFLSVLIPVLVVFLLFTKDLHTSLIKTPNFLPENHIRNDPQTMYPFIHGDMFRAYADFVIDEGLQPIDPDKVKKGDIIFLRAEWLDFFFETVHPLIKKKYILLTHNEFNDVDLPGKWVCYLDDPKLAGWFGKSMGIPYHFKAFPLPLGIKNIPRRHQEQPLDINKKRLFQPLKTMVDSSPIPKVNLLYINFSLCTENRIDVMNLFQNKPYTYFAEKLDFENYLVDIASSKFVLSPKGTCEDCYRTWESMLLGSIPIIKSSFLDKLFNNLPVLIVDEWEEISAEFLLEKYKEIKSKPYKKEKLFIDFWLEKLIEYQKLVVSDKEFSFKYE